MVHELKIKPEFFKDALEGLKTFEVRENDRNYHIGDYLALNEFVDGIRWYLNAKRECVYVSRDERQGIQRGPAEFTGRSVLARVTYVLTDDRFVRPGFAVLGIKLCDVYLGDENGKVDTSKIL